MKVMLGYYKTADGSYMGDSPRADCGDYIMAIGVIRKKICEKPDASPYKNRDTVNRFSRTYCDENRLDVQLVEYKSFIKKERIKHTYYWAYDTNDTRKGRHKIIENIIKSIVINKLPYFIKIYGIKNNRYVYLPGYFEDLVWPTNFQN